MSQLLQDGVVVPPAVTDVHRPHRPDWACTACRRPWPCAPVREALLDEAQIHPTNVRLYLAGHLEAACRDFPTMLAGELRNRLLGWVVTKQDATR